MATVRCSASPCRPASAATASRSRTPHAGSRASGSRRRRRCSARCAAHAGGTARRDRAGLPAASRRAAPAISPSAAVHGAMWIMLIDTTASARVDRPDRAPRHPVRAAEAGSATGPRRMGRDAAPRLRVGIGRLPDDMGQGGGEMDGVLAAAAGDFQHGSRRRQHLPQYRQDRIAVARDRGRREGVVKRREHSPRWTFPIRQQP